jgi:hypothetical protein
MYRKNQNYFVKNAILMFVQVFLNYAKPKYKTAVIIIEELCLNVDERRTSAS